MKQSEQALAATLFASVGIPASQGVITLATTERVHNKKALGRGALAFGWKNYTFASVNELADLLKSGKAICGGALYTDHRIGTNMQGVILLGADYDNASVEQLLCNSFIRHYAAIVYPTPSNTPEAPRSRALFILDRMVTVAEQRLFIRRLLTHLGKHDIDPRCTDPARIWYGSTHQGYYVREHRLPVAVLENLPDPTSDERANFEAPVFTGSVTNDELHAYYYNPNVGRNNMLYATARVARDNGIDEATFKAWFVEDYAKEAPRPHVSNPVQEPYETRTGEARNTIASAYKSKRRAQRPTAIPNAIFEVCASQKQHNIPRLYEALLLAGWQPGMFEANEAISELAGVMGHNTVRDALKARVCVRIDTKTGEKVFISPFCHTSYTVFANAKTGVQFGELNQRRGKGRPTGSGQVFTLPSINDLCAMFGIEHRQVGDAVDPSAILSVKTYKQGKHAKLIERNPDKQFGMKLLKDRLGVTRRTIYRYNEAMGIVSTPVYRKTPITWGNVKELPYASETEPFMHGMFIEDATGIDPTQALGEKHPPLLSVAIRLLSEGRIPYLTRRESNSYAYRPKVRRSMPIVKVIPATYSQPNYNVGGAEKNARVNLASAPSVAELDAPPGISRLNPFSIHGRTKS